MKRRWPLLVAGVFGVGLLVFATWQLWQVASQGPERVRELLESAGAWTPLVYVLSFALLEPFGALAIFFVGPGSLIWSWPTLFLLSWLGAVGASAVGFGFARGLGRDWVESRIPARLRSYEARLERNPLLAVALVRLVFFLWPPAHWMLGLSRVRFTPFIVGSAIGFIPGMLGFTWLGKGIVDAILEQTPDVLVPLAVVGTLIMILLGWQRARRRGTPPRPQAQPVASSVSGSDPS